MEAKIKASKVEAQVEKAVNSHRIGGGSIPAIQKIGPKQRRVWSLLRCSPGVPGFDPQWEELEKSQEFFWGMLLF